MIEIRINKEIGNFEPKFVGPFTIRQAVCLFVAAPVCYFIYKYASPIITSDLAGFFCAIPAAVAVAVGWIKPYGMRMEKFIQSIFINRLIAPANRKYQTVNQHEKLLLNLRSLSHELEEKERSATGGKSKPKKQKQPKYKVSPEAVQ